MNEVDQAIPEADGVELHVVMDNYATHKTQKVRRWFARRPRYHVHFTPTSASWLNQVERFFPCAAARLALMSGAGEVLFVASQTG